MQTILQEGLNNYEYNEEYIEIVTILFNCKVHRHTNNSISYWKFPTNIGNPDVIRDIDFKGDADNMVLNTLINS